MPAIVDFAYNYTTTTSGTTIAIDVPDTATGDVLLAVLTADTGTQTFTSTGWTAVTGGAFSNTTRTYLMWRVSTGASEPLSYTFTASASETFNGFIISLRDVDTTTPFLTPAGVNRAANNTAFPSVTTTRNNSLILYFGSHPSTAVIPSNIEKGAIQLFQMDGSAHSDSIGWTIKAIAGATGTTVPSSVSGTTYGGSLVTLVVQPPSGGATLIPTYCVDDLSELIDPLHGTTAFRGNTAPAALATTYYTGNIAGKTVANATLTQRLDTGINSYRTTAGQSSATNRTWQGINSQFAAAKTNWSGKNILAHVQTYIPADIQTLEGVGLGRGVAMGMHTSASNFKVWHVHGANTAFGVKMTPVVINTDNTTGVIQTTGTLNAASVAGMGFFVSGFVTSADMIWTMVWMLDTTTVAGGSSTTPITIPGIVRAISDGHERISALQQGKNQMLCLQPFQIGNGTVPVYANLSAAAVEFPQQYDVASQQVFYCSADNVAGVTFYPASGDYLDLRSSTWSSGSRFHWRWHASSSNSATILTEGMQVIGGGDVQLRNVVAFDSMTFNNCLTITQNSATISNCNIVGSYIVSNALASIQNNTFESSGTGHAIEITTPGTYTFTGNQFDGYGATGTTNAAIYNNSGGSVTLNIAGGGASPTYRNGSGATTSVVSAANVTLTGLKTNSEVRAYLGTNPATSTEIDGIESSGTSFTFSHSVAGQSGYIVILNNSYQPIWLDIVYSGSDVSIPIQQITDRQYLNP